MADKTINDLASLATPANDDLVGVWDTSAGQFVKVRRDVLNGGVLTGGGTVATAGFTLTLPATGTAALLGTQQVYTARETFQGGIVSGTQTGVGDDTAFSITPPSSNGIFVLWTANLNTAAGAVYFRTLTGSAGQCALIASGPSTIVSTTTDTVLAGTTGTDGRVTISANAPDAKIYIENRSGGSRNFSWLFIA